VTTGKVLTGALLATLAAPATWPLALGAFLLRGGILLVALPIVVLPTTVGLGTALAPALMPVVFGSVSAEFVVAVGAIVVGVLAWLVGGGWLAATLEAEAARIVARDEDLALVRETPGSAGQRSGGDAAARILAVRLLASVPLAIALALGSVRLVNVAYRELTSPLDVVTPVVLRVVVGAPEAVIGLVLTWMVAEIVGALAARRITLASSGVLVALRDAIATCLREPIATLVGFWLPTVALALVLAPSSLAAASAFGGMAAILGERPDPLRLLVSVVVSVALWGIGLVLTSVTCAWRGAVWTVLGVTGEGTFGGSSTPPTGSLAD
jgi:hypothetical protein